ncbi:Bug family tripartite tricarboxylate transporter substrate binding protein [Achromobacter denitrificans]|uniref:Bug family tripartite tricarboxylate transporter substrate binding protein n=1 Tax=Achromobacter denitrificans TaxID=32002 RepID=UPI0020CBAFA5|nr:tripartite tricarboxylate transporter substrate binding protein [Achromobacter denitrificans]MDX3877125.1 tripartite tricarboxylate transporter substrate binding protein [Achromobacter sp.]
MIARLRLHALLLAAATAFSMPLEASAQAAGGDAKVVRLVVGYAAGGAADAVARAYAEQLQAAGYANVIVENRPGASGRLGFDAVKRAKADGLTLYLGSSPMFVIFPLTYRKLGYDPDHDLRPVAVVADVPTAAVAGASQPYGDMPGYVQWAKQARGKANLGLATLGSPGQLGTIEMAKQNDLQVEPVVYRGAAPMLVDVVSGEVSMGWDAVASMMPLYSGGKLKFLGVAGSRRLPMLPDVPTLLEQGYPQYQYASSWYGIYAPAGTPDAAVSGLEQALLAAGKNPALVEKLQASGFLVEPRSGAQARQRMETERAHWAPIVKAAGIVFDE